MKIESEVGIALRDPGTGATGGKSEFERDRTPATEAGFWILVYPLAL